MGIQSLVAHHNTPIARHAARLLLHPNSMWSEMMRARYGYDTWSAGSVIQMDQWDSFISKEICLRTQVVLDRVRWVVGDGRGIDLLYDFWIADLPLVHWPTYISMETINSMRVGDLLQPRGGVGWQVDVVTQLFG